VASRLHGFDKPSPHPVPICRGGDSDEFTAVGITPVGQNPFEPVTPNGHQARQTQHVDKLTEPCLLTSAEPAV
jgi:hypothetical protein